MKANKEYKEGIETVIELLQLFHDSLDTAGEPKGLCSYCGAAFESVSLVKAHILVCKDNPLIAEIERLRENQDKLIAACGKLMCCIWHDDCESCPNERECNSSSSPTNPAKQTLALIANIKEVE